MSRVVVAGTFDRLHAGHLGYFQKLRVLAGAHGEVIVGVNSDEFAAAYKRVPQDDEITRMHNVAATDLVDGVFINPGFERQGAAILAQRPDIVAITDDWYPPQKYADQLWIPSIDWFEDHGIVFCYLMRSGEGISTTEILATEAVS